MLRYRLHRRLLSCRESFCLSWSIGRCVLLVVCATGSASFSSHLSGWMRVASSISKNGKGIRCVHGREELGECAGVKLATFVVCCQPATTLSRKNLLTSLNVSGCGGLYSILVLVVVIQPFSFPHFQHTLFFGLVAKAFWVCFKYAI